MQWKCHVCGIFEVEAITSVSVLCPDIIDSLAYLEKKNLMDMLE